MILFENSFNKQETPLLPFLSTKPFRSFLKRCFKKYHLDKNLPIAPSRRISRDVRPNSQNSKKWDH